MEVDLTSAADDKVAVPVVCDGHTHVVVVTPNGFTMLNHDTEVEEVAVAFGGTPTGCTQAIELVASLTEACSLGQLDAAWWVAIGATDAAFVTAWQSLGMNTPADVLAWRNAGAKTLGEVRRWREAGASTPDDVSVWSAAGFNAADMKLWTNAGITDVATAVQWCEAGATIPRQVEGWKAKGVSSPSALSNRLEWQCRQTSLAQRGLSVRQERRNARNRGRSL